MLFDEVTSALDPELTGEVLKVIERAGRRRHDHGDGHPRDGLRAQGIADQIVFMHRGKVHETGPGLDPDVAGDAGTHAVRRHWEL